MSHQKKQKLNITNTQLMFRLKRLPIINHLKVSEIIAYIGLILVNKGNVIPLGKGLRIIKKSKLDLKIEPIELEQLFSLEGKEFEEGAFEFLLKKLNIPSNIFDTFRALSIPYWI